MANLNTRSKRASAVGILSPCVLAPVLPDGTIGRADWQHIARCYSGIWLVDKLAIVVCIDQARVFTWERI